MVYFLYPHVAQLVEQQTFNLWVLGSSPGMRTMASLDGVADEANIGVETEA